MPRLDTFTFRISPEESQLLDRLAEHLERSKSDAMRFILRQTVRELESTEIEQEQQADDKR